MEKVIIKNMKNFYCIKPRDKTCRFMYSDFIIGLINLLRSTYLIAVQNFAGELEVILYDLNKQEIDVNVSRKAYQADKVYLSGINFEEYTDSYKIDFEKLFVFENSKSSYILKENNNWLAKFELHPDGLNQIHCYIKADAILQALFNYINNYNSISMSG